jgi:glucose-1-phosphate cytidylyltransferase
MEKTMKVAILAGGMGTRLSEETITRPKPMVEIGGRPILWHIMKIYAHYGFHEFIIALGYKGDVIKRYFLDFPYIESSCLTIEQVNRVSTPKVFLNNYRDTFLSIKVHLLETGLLTQTGGRVKQLLEFAKEPIMLTYGDGVANIDINKLLEFHRDNGKLVTITAVRPLSRFGKVVFSETSHIVESFSEKPSDAGDYINGGFMVLEPEVLKYFDGGDCNFEKEVLPKVASDRQLVGYDSDGFWHCMDTMRDVQHLNELWEAGKAEWKVWND